MIAIIPTALGGIWQLIKLSLISSSVIHFFSISQLIADGLSIFFYILFPFTLISPMLVNNVNDLYTIKKIKDTDLSLDTSDIFKFLGLVFAIILVVMKFNQFIRLDSFEKLSGLMLLFQILFLSVFFFLFKILRKYHLIEIYFVFWVLTCLIFTLYSFNRIYENTDNIENFDVLIKNIEKKDCYSKEPKVLYFNDKYIFIEIEKKQQKSILIKKIDDLFVD